ncbi:MAG TPA: hypothetical protein VJV03_16765 [Pyrinomonadaceae bacterium]|nr:hypothetical protein [Pyrinomonadaceae bacterium]
MEIYLPKKANFQGTLYETLTQGFDLEVVKAHFNNPLKEPRIKDLLNRYHTISQYDARMIDDFQRVFFGYSLYEVDGVFTGSRGIIEERVQAIRIIFKPDYDYLFDNFRLSKIEKENNSQIRVIVRRFLRFSSPDVSAFIEGLDKDENFEVKRELLQFVDKWIEYTCLFVFGYLVYEICAKITLLYHEDNIDLDKIEEEVWVTSFWNLGVNRICFKAECD